MGGEVNKESSEQSKREKQSMASLTQRTFGALWGLGSQENRSQSLEKGFPELDWIPPRRNSIRRQPREKQLALLLHHCLWSHLHLKIFPIRKGWIKLPDLVLPSDEKFKTRAGLAPSAGTVQQHSLIITGYFQAGSRAEVSNSFLWHKCYFVGVLHVFHKM